MKILLKEDDLDLMENTDSLNPQIFDIENEKMNMDVRKKFLRLANIFFERLDITDSILDVWLVGELANYNWSIYSDIKIRGVVNLSEIKNNKEIFDKIQKWSEEHDIVLMDFSVDLNLDDKKTKEYDGEGVYSIMYDRWLSNPIFLEQKYDTKSVGKYVMGFLKRMKDIIKNSQDANEKKASFEKMFDYANSLKNSKESDDKKTAFNYLRRNGIIKKAGNVKNNALDYEYSSEHNNADIAGKQKRLRMGSDWVKNKDFYSKDDDKKDDDGYTDGISYSIHGAVFPSLRKASESTGESKSTIQYRVKSKNPKYSDYKVIYDR